MRNFSKAPVFVALLGFGLTLLAGCSSSNGSASNTTDAATSSTGGTSTTTTGGASNTTGAIPSGLPATGSVDGFTLSVTSSPATGTLGHTTIRVVAVLKGAVKPATLKFEISDRVAANVGRPATEQRVTVSGPGTYVLPHAFSPGVAGSWATTVTFLPKKSRASKLSVSGLPPVAGSPSPFPQLVTVVTPA